MPSQCEENLSKAILSYQEGQSLSIRACAIAFSVPVSTLSHRLSGRLPRSPAHALQQILSIAEEEALIKWISRLSKAGCPITLPLTRSLAEEIRSRRYALSSNPPSYPPIGKRYLDRLRDRHPTIATIYSRKIEANRYNGTSYTIVERFFAALSDLFLEHRYPPDCVFNADESGFAIGDSNTSKVLVNIRDLSSFKKIPGRQEWVTAIECIAASGVALPPLVIFRAQYTNSGWIPASTPPNWRFSTSNVIRGEVHQVGKCTTKQLLTPLSS